MSTQKLDPYVPELERKYIKFEVPTDEIMTAIAAVDAAGGMALMRIEDKSIQFESVNDAKTLAVTSEATGIDASAGPEDVSLAVETAELYSRAYWHGMPYSLGFRIDSDPDHPDEAVTVYQTHTMDYVTAYDPEEATTVSLPDMERTTTATVDAVDLKSAVGAVSLGKKGYHTLTVKEDGVTVSAGHTWEMGAERTVSARVDGPEAESYFETGVLSRILGSIPPESKLKLTIRDEYPVTLRTDNISATVAPRIDPRDDR